MDLSRIDTKALANEGSVLELRAPDGSAVLQDDGKTPVSITLLGDDADVIVRHNNSVANQYLRAQGQAMTVEAALDIELAKYAKATVAWDGVVVDGETLECDEVNAKSLYRRFPWIRDQVRVFMGDRARFMRASAIA